MRLLTILLALFIASLALAEVHWSRNLLLPQYRSLTSAAKDNLHFPDLPPPAGTGILIGNQDAGKIDLLLITAPGKNPRVAGLLMILWQGYDPTPESDPPIPKLSKGRRVVLLLGASLAMVCLALGFILPDRIPWARPLSSFAIVIANLPLLLVYAFPEKSKPADPEDQRSPTVT